MGSRVLSPRAPSRVRVVPCRFSGSASPGCQTTCLPSTAESDGEIVGSEMAVARGRIGRVSASVSSVTAPVIDGRSLRYSDLELRHRQPPIDKHKRRVILKLPIRRPLHANQLRREHREPRIADRHNGLRIGHRIVRRLSRPRRGLHRRLMCRILLLRSLRRQPQPRCCQHDSHPKPRKILHGFPLSRMPQASLPLGSNAPKLRHQSNTVNSANTANSANSAIL